MSEIDYDNLQHHPVSERLVQAMCKRTQSDNPLFFRVSMAYFFATVAASMRAMIKTPEGNKIPVNVFALSLAPSNFGKGQTIGMMEEEVLDQFMNRFQEETFPILAEENIPKLANKRAIRNATDPDEELARVEKEFRGTGPLMYSFDSGSDSALKQMRHKLLMANAGSLNLQVDEIGKNIMKVTDLLDVLLELYDGKTKTKLIKQTSDQSRTEEIRGLTPTNMMLFGAPSMLLNGGKQEDELMAMLDTGYARRCFFSYAKTNRRKERMSPEESLARAKEAQDDSTLSDLSDHFGNLGDIINVNKTLMVPDETALVMYQYKDDCEAAAQDYSEHHEARKTELESRFFKALKLAGVYAFVDDSPEITPVHYQAAIKLAEESGQALEQLLCRDKPYVKLAKYIADLRQEVTQADLVEDLPFYKGPQAAKNEMMTLAIAYGYKNNIIIKKSFQDGIEFLRGESLKVTDLNEMTVSYSNDIVEGYQAEAAPFDQLHKLTQAAGMHWTNHHLKDGYRNEDNAIPGFNTVVVDVDGGTTMDAARLLLKDFKTLMYTTKRHGVDGQDRFRIIFPTSHELKLDAKDFKEFYKNVLEWLPFEADAGVGQRSRKWLSHNGHHEYNDGEMLDVLPFIPKTAKNEARQQLLENQQQMDNLERWVINNTGDGNRNNMLLRFGMILVDTGADYGQIQQKVFDLNDKIADKLPQAEIMGTVMVSVGKAIGKRP